MLGFRGNIAGAWRAFDEDLSGYISLKELDEEASKVLLGFRRWAIQEPLGGDVLRLKASNRSNALRFPYSVDFRGKETTCLKKGPKTVKPNLNYREMSWGT